MLNVCFLALIDIFFLGDSAVEFVQTFTVFVCVGRGRQLLMLLCFEHLITTSHKSKHIIHIYLICHCVKLFVLFCDDVDS